MMNEDYKKWEAEKERIQADNKVLLQEFESWLAQSGLKASTISSHSQNVDFYINDYLLYTDDLVEAKDGALEIGYFLGDWFIRKAMWSSKAHLKANAASFKKFYTFLLSKGLIEKEELAEMKALIKEEMPDWLDSMSRYDDLSYDVW